MDPHWPHLSRSSYSLSDPSAAPFVTSSTTPSSCSPPTYPGRFFQRHSSPSCPSLASGQRSSNASDTSDPPSGTHDAFLTSSSKDLEPPLRPPTLLIPNSNHEASVCLPPGSWDTHIHVMSPEYSLSPSAPYTPHAALLPQALAFEKKIGISNVVIVQPSVYGDDNSCTLAALRALGTQRARAIVVFDPHTIKESVLVYWHLLGVRGVRVNMVSTESAITEAEFEAEIRKYAALIRPYKWVLELYIPMTWIPIVERIAPELDVTILLDHFGEPVFPPPEALDESDSLSKIAGFDSLLRLLTNHKAYVKFSALYRCIDDVHEQRLLEQMAKTMLRAAPDRVVWGSDWPHTRHEEVDVVPFIKECVRWCDGDEEVVRKVFAQNAGELFQVGSPKMGEGLRECEELGQF
ncbi:MAG: hypothetical protein Q9162_003491 [Coniocarpon cinnabarinum]